MSLCTEWSCSVFHLLPSATGIMGGSPPSSSPHLSAAGSPFSALSSQKGWWTSHNMWVTKWHAGTRDSLGDLSTPSPCKKGAFSPIGHTGFIRAGLSRSGKIGVELPESAWHFTLHRESHFKNIIISAQQRASTFPPSVQ